MLFSEQVAGFAAEGFRQQNDLCRRGRGFALLPQTDGALVDAEDVRELLLRQPRLFAEPPKVFAD